MKSILLKNNNHFIPDSLTLESIEELTFDQNIVNELKKNGLDKIIIDFQKVNEIDSAGVAWLDQFNNFFSANQISTQSTNQSVEIRRIIETFSYRYPSEDLQLKKNSNFFLNLGNHFLQFLDQIRYFFILFVDVIYFSCLSLIGKSQHQRGSVTEQANLIGVNAVSIISLMSFLVGLILALQSAIQLRQFGANIFIADLIAISMINEMGPLMTAIMLSGRSGSAIASEIATMVVTEEIDALNVMDLNPYRFIIVPKFLAMTLVIPLLTIISDISGIFGGFLIGCFYLDLPVNAFFNQLVNAITMDAFLKSLMKSFFFGWMIVIVGSFYGLKVKGGAEGVGKATTSAVVVSIFLVILIDALFSLVLYF